MNNKNNILTGGGISKAPLHFQILHFQIPIRNQMR